MTHALPHASVSLFGMPAPGEPAPLAKHGGHDSQSGSRAQHCAHLPRLKSARLVLVGWGLKKGSRWSREVMNTTKHPQTHTCRINATSMMGCVRSNFLMRHLMVCCLQCHDLSLFSVPLLVRVIGHLLLTVLLLGYGPCVLQGFHHAHR